MDRAPLSTRAPGGRARRRLGSGTLRHTRGPAESCFLPDLTRFTGSRCAGPDPQRLVRVVPLGGPSLEREFSPPDVGLGYRAPRAPRLARSAPEATRRQVPSCPLEGCESGRIGTLGKRVWGDSPWVRIPLPPLVRCDVHHRRVGPDCGVDLAVGWQQFTRAPGVASAGDPYALHGDVRPRPPGHVCTDGHAQRRDACRGRLCGRGSRLVRWHHVRGSGLGAFAGGPGTAAHGSSVRDRLHHAVPGIHERPFRRCARGAPRCGRGSRFRIPASGEGG